MKLTPLLSLASSRSALLAVGLLALQSCEYVEDFQGKRSEIDGGTFIYQP